MAVGLLISEKDGDFMIEKINGLKHRVEHKMIELLLRTTEELIKRIENGDAAPQDISNAIRLCKENDININIKEGKLLAVVENNEDLPFMTDHTIAS